MGKLRKRPETAGFAGVVGEIPAGLEQALPGGGYAELI
jgi:hypothetical protein